mgnify:CR=1 FL=1
MPSGKLGSKAKSDFLDFFRSVSLLVILAGIVFLAYKIIPFLLPRAPEETYESVEEPLNLVESSFTETFSGIGWIDTEKTTAWHDLKTSSFMLPPKYELRELNNFTSLLSGVEIVNFQKGGYDCVAVCKKGEILVLNPVNKKIVNISPAQTAGYNLVGLDYLANGGEWVVLGEKDGNAKVWIINVSPAEAVLREIAALGAKGDVGIACLRDKCLLRNGIDVQLLTFSGSRTSAISGVQLPVFDAAGMQIGRTDAFWLIGFVADNGENEFGRAEYRSSFYKFDGEKFARVLEKDFISEYRGDFSFGGTSADWLAIYGAYQGQAWHFSATENYMTENWSRFFGIRVMEEKGFKPQILENGGAFYIGAGNSLPKLLKVESNTATDLSRLLKDFRYNILAEGSEANSVLIAAIDQEGSTRIFMFKNLGFDQSVNRAIYSKSVHSGNPIWSARFSYIEGTVGLRLYFSADGGEEWVEARNGEKTVFEKSGTDLRWRAILEKQKPKFVTPSLNLLEVKYEVLPVIPN